MDNNKPREQRPGRPSKPGGFDSVLLPDFCGPEYLAKYLNIPLEGILRSLEAGEIPASRLAGRWIIDREQFAKALKERVTLRLPETSEEGDG